MTTLQKTILLTLLALILSSTAAIAQRLGEWKVYPSYWNATKCNAAGRIIYTLCNQNLLAYDTEDTSVHTFDCQTGLNGVQITSMNYSQDAHTLVLVYSDGGIDLMDDDFNVVHLSGLKDKEGMEKTVNAICVDGHVAYLCTSSGYIELDLKEKVLRNYYNLDLQVKDMAIINDEVYLATNKGVYFCAASDNKFNRASWTQVTAEPYTRMIPFDGMIWIVCYNNVSIFNPATKTRKLYKEGPFNFLTLAGDRLVWGDAKRLFIHTAQEGTISIDFPNKWKDVIFNNNIYWACVGDEGLCGFGLKDDAMTQVAGPVLPNSPMRDLFYRMHWIGNRLLVSGGINTYSDVYKDPTAMIFEDGNWTNFEPLPIDSLMTIYPSLKLANTTNLVQDPNDPNHHFASLHRNGLVEYRNGKFAKFYNCDNSPIQSILPNSSKYYNYVSCAGAQYDPDGNLWMLNNETKTLIRFLQPNGKWGELYYPDLEGANLCDDYLFHSSGLIFVNSRANNHGLFCFDTNGTFNTQVDDHHKHRSVIVNQDNTSYLPNAFYCQVEDFDGRVWCGTDMGLFVIDDPTTYFDDDFRFTQVKISRNDGSGLADYLLNGVAISCIAIDGGNRKWVGTNTDGVYLLSEDGTEMIHHFTKANSPIISDAINAIAIHSETGLVMIGTSLGLCSFMADATQSVEDMTKGDGPLVFPNPVRPDYNGPIAVRGLELDSEVKILSTTGQLICSGTSAGGTFTWDGTTPSGKRAPSGVYHIVANDANGNRAVVARVMIVR